jgi:hypothetical protein
MALKDKFIFIDWHKNFINCTTGLTPYLESDLAPPSQLPTTTRRHPRGEESVAAGSVRSTLSVTFADELPLQIEQPSSCGGITLEYIRGMKKLAPDKMDSRLLGFTHTVREGWNTREKMEHPNNKDFDWQYCLPIVSVLTSGNNVDEIVWKIEQIDSRTKPDGARPCFEKFVIRHRDCDPTPGAALQQRLCSSCFGKKRLLMDRFDSHIDKRSNQIAPQTRTGVLRTSSLQREQTKHWMRRAKNLSMKLSY